MTPSITNALCAIITRAAVLEINKMTTITILLLTAAIEAPLFYLHAIQRAEAAYLDLYNLKG